MDKNKIAVIIPAYKSNYLEQTLESFLNQTNKNFTIYIGNDNSPYDIESIVNKFEGKLDIVYHKFEDNLGAISLIKQWERCVDLSSEKWIWLFSDDDLVSNGCVEKFYEFLDDQNEFYKFQTEIINEKNEKIFKKFDKKNAYKEFLDSKEFISNRIKCNGFRSFAVEYIFSRELYTRNKFIEFPLAWASDDASWLTYSIDAKKIKCIPAIVSWRSSGSNISMSRVNDTVNHNKIQASIKYCYWLKNTLAKNKIIIQDKDILHWLSVQIASISYKINFSDFKAIIDNILLDVSELIIIKNYLMIKLYHIRNNF
ncbi:glycosyltransferase family 2 protein [Flavobacterium sp. 3-210]